MGFMLRVRLASFFAGAAAAAAGGGYFLYKDYKLAHDSMALKEWRSGVNPRLDGVNKAQADVSSVLFDVPVKGLQDSTDARYKALEKRLAALEGQQSTGAAPDASD